MIFSSNYMKKVALLLCTCWCMVGMAAETDFGGEVGVSVEKKLGRAWNLSLSEKLRFNNNFTQYNRSKTELVGSYSFCRKYLKVGAGYAFINKQKEPKVFCNQHRFFAQLTASHKFLHVKLAFRTRLQATLSDARYEEVKHNPKYYWRNKLSVDYIIRNSRFTPFATFEVYCLLNPSRYQGVSNLRSVLGCDYRVSRDGSLTFDVQMRNYINQKIRKNSFSVELTYAHKL